MRPSERDARMGTAFVEGLAAGLAAPPVEIGSPEWYALIERLIRRIRRMPGVMWMSGDGE